MHQRNLRHHANTQVRNSSTSPEPGAEEEGVRGSIGLGVVGKNQQHRTIDARHATNDDENSVEEGENLTSKDSPTLLKKAIAPMITREVKQKTLKQPAPKLSLIHI